MWPYLLKSSACLICLWAFYRLFLENSSMHHFKRFYLLGSLAAALIIPILTFRYAVTLPAGISSPAGSVYGTVQALPSQGQEGTDWFVYIRAGYFSISLMLLLKFLGTLLHLFRKIRAYPTEPYKGSQLILHDREEVPHSFMRYIFLNRNAYYSGAIPKPVLAHEKAHVRQWHSLDILILEVLQLFLWINPVFFLIKRAVRLNHEFLADREVLHAGCPLARYQQYILAFTETKYRPEWAHAINYSSIKKRFTIMKKNTPTPSKYLRFALLLPLFTLLLYSFSTKVPVYTSQDETPRISTQDSATSEMVAEYNTLAAKYNAMSPDNFQVQGREVDRMTHIYNLMSASQKAGAEPFPTLPEPPSPPAPLAMRSAGGTEDEEEIYIDTNIEQEIVTDIRSEVETDIETAVESEIESDIRTEVEMDIETDIEIEESVEIEQDIEGYEPGKAADAQEEMEYEVRRDMRKVRKNKVEEKNKRKNKNIDEKDRARHTKKRTMVYTTTRDSATSINKNRDFSYRRSTRGIPAPPTPPGAAGPEIDMKDLASRGAVFYLEGKEVSAEEAMEFIENTQQIKVHVQDNKGQKPVVRLSSGGS